MARVSFDWYNEIVHCRRLPLAVVNFISTKDGERVLAPTPDKNMEKVQENAIGKDVI